MRKYLSVIFILAIVALFAGQASAAWLSGYTYRKKITIDATKVGSSTHTNFPTLVSTTDADLKTTGNGGKVTNASGYDIVFTSAEGTSPLSFEVESYSATTGALIAWVNVPSVSNSANTDLYVYYGNSGISSDQSNINGVWDSNFKGVWHLKEDPSGAAPQMIDSTSLANSLTSNGSMVTADQVTGKINGSLTFEGTDDYLSRTYDSDFDFGTGSFTVSGWIKSTGSSLITTAVSTVAASSDDAEECQGSDINPAGSMTVTSTDIELVYDSNDSTLATQIAGFRFPQVPVPQGASILSAKITVTADINKTPSVNLVIAGQAVDNAPSFFASTSEISSRTTTATTASWSITSAWTANTAYDSVDISPVVQEIVNRSGWASNNAMAFMVTGTDLVNFKKVYSYDTSPANAARLTITYASPQYVVARYNADAGYKVWMTSEGKIALGLDDNTVWSPDFSALSSASTYDDGNWHHFAAVKSANSDLYLYVDGAQAGTSSLALSGSVARQIKGYEDDAEERISTGAVTPAGGDLELPYDAYEQIIGTRFQNITVPQGANIDSASVTFTAKTSRTNNLIIRVSGEAVDNASQFTTTTGNISGRTPTSAYVAWNITTDWVAGSTYSTDSLAAIIQEIVNRSGWQSGNSLVLMYRRDPSDTGTPYQNAYSVDAGQPLAPTLNITWSKTAGTLNSSTAPLHLAADAPTAANFLKGTLDEIKISSAARSADWVLAEYNNQNSPGAFYAVAAEESSTTTTTTTTTTIASAKQLIINDGVRQLIINDGVKQKIVD